MFARLSTIFLSVVALAGVATAVPTDLEARNGGTTSQCNTGSMQCCSSTYSSSSYVVTEIFGFLGLPLPTTTGSVGLSCSPITVGGTGVGSTCTQQPVCCTDNTFNGVIGVGCSPITING